MFRQTPLFTVHRAVLFRKFATEGSYAMEGSAIIKLADLNSLWLETQVNVNYAKNLKLGQNASITFTDYPNKTINAKVSFINPEINPEQDYY